MIYKDLFDGILNRFAMATGLPTICYPNVPATPNGDHIIVSILPAETRQIGISETNQARGLIQALIRVKENKGAITAADYADKVLTLFKRNTEITNNGVYIRIDRDGFISPPLNSDGWYSLPVTIPYNSLY